MRTRVVAFVAAVIVAGLALAATSSGPRPTLTYHDHVVEAGHVDPGPGESAERSPR
ncbi:MAG TPA: hypothetical protein VI854_05765 [Acidimicrobiia bacterium]|nr:hypothetical protein [Acidimicrobiia bacterium]